MAPWAKVLATMVDGMNLIPGTYEVGGKPSDLHMHTVAHEDSPTSTQIKKRPSGDRTLKWWFTEES